MRRLLVVLLYLINQPLSFAYCDPTVFRWECDLPARAKPITKNSSLVYCGNVRMYLNSKEYDILTRYQRDNINMVLKINGEYVDAPCIPAGRRGAD